MKIVWESPEINFNELRSSFEENQEEYDNIEEGELKILGKLLQTPFGVFEIDDPFSPMKQTELRIGYTDFSITNDVATIINGCPGVDAFRVMSRYSFIIGIGKVFEFTEVLRTLENLLGCFEPIKEKDENINELIKSLSGNKYAILIMPNGNYEYTTDKDPNFKNTLENFKQIKEKTNSKIIFGP